MFRLPLLSSQYWFSFHTAATISPRAFGFLGFSVHRTWASSRGCSVPLSSTSPNLSFPPGLFEGCGTEGGEHQDRQSGQAPEGRDHCRLWQDRSGETLCHCQGVESTSGTHPSKQLSVRSRGHPHRGEGSQPQGSMPPWP